jgi:hypothetical protein
VSNIFTDSVRVYAGRDHRIDEVEAEWITWMLLGPRGSYHVPVVTRGGPQGRYVDIQYGSGKSADIVDFCADQIGGHGYSAIWGRRFDEGSDADEIWSDHVSDGPRRYCRYGFDEVRVTATGERPPVASHAPWQRRPDGSWRLPVAGSYRTGNDRHADVGPSAAPGTVLSEPASTALPTPTTPNSWGEALIGIDPPWLGPLADEHPGVTHIEYRWRGRLVHRARVDDDDLDGRAWQHRCADDWDNCLDPEFLRFTGTTGLRAPDQAYEQDQHAWRTRSR